MTDTTPPFPISPRRSATKVRALTVADLGLLRPAASMTEAEIATTIDLAIVALDMDAITRLDLALYHTPHFVNPAVRRAVLEQTARKVAAAALAVRNDPAQWGATTLGYATGEDHFYAEVDGTTLSLEWRPFGPWHIPLPGC